MTAAQRVRRRLQIQLWIRTALIVLFTAAVVWIISATEGLFVSTVVAIVIAYLFAPVVDYLERSGLSRPLATAIPFFFGLFAIIVGFLVVLPLVGEQVRELLGRLPQLQEKWVTSLLQLEFGLSEKLGLTQLGIAEKLNVWLAQKSTTWSAELPTAISQSLTVLLLSPFFAYFLLADGNRFGRTSLQWVPNAYFEIILNLRHQLNSQIGSFIRARFLEAAIVGAIIWVGLLAIGFPYSAVLALVAAVANLIPYLGPIFGAVPALAIAVFSEEATALHGAGNTIGLIALVYFVAQVVDTVIVIPLLVARIVNLHPVTVVISILVGAQVGGILGMIVAIPAASATKLIMKAIVPLTNAHRLH